MTMRCLFLLALNFLLTSWLSAQPPKHFRVGPQNPKLRNIGQMFFATNRSVLALDATEETSTFFSKYPTSQLKYGLINYTYHGDKHEPGKFDDTVEFRSRGRRSENATLSTTSNKETVVYLHGYNSDFDSTVKQAVLLNYDLGVNHLWITYSWSSEGNPAAYPIERMDIKHNAPALAEFLLKITQQRPSETVNLLVHSMGNDILLSAIDWLDKHGELKNLKLGRVILVAPDVSQEHFKASVPKLLEASRRVVHYFSSEDKALALSRRANLLKGVRAGATVVEVQGLEAINVDQVNSPTDRHGHSYYAASAPVMKDIAAILKDESASKTPPERIGNSVEKRQTDSGYEYWAFRFPKDRILK